MLLLKTIGWQEITERFANYIFRGNYQDWKTTLLSVFGKLAFFYTFVWLATLFRPSIFVCSTKVRTGVIQTLNFWHWEHFYPASLKTGLDQTLLSKKIVSKLKIIVIRQKKCIFSQKWDVFDFLYISKFSVPGNSREFPGKVREFPFPGKWNSPGNWQP